ncbi:MAG: pyridoxamine 5'-phosphate oxidase family protein, partial [Sulfurimicrobium sp.]|nr:pyridoxamine 5'-phosphate oxidase family protein [Sulfurimicrobium sp.]
NPQIGMLFVNFENRTRVRINGAAEIMEDVSMYSSIWPLAQRYVRVTPVQVYGNCKSRIPRMLPVAPNDSFFHDE